MKKNNTLNQFKEIQLTITRRDLLFLSLLARSKADELKELGYQESLIKELDGLAEKLETTLERTR